MKKKELKALAGKIAKCEFIIQTSSDDKDIKRAQHDILMLSGRVESLEDMTIIDEMVQDILAQQLDK